MDENTRVFAETVSAAVLVPGGSAGESEEQIVRLDRWEIPDGRTLICSRDAREVRRYEHGDWLGISAFGLRIEEEQTR